jgi:hypothetical protein
MRDFGEKMNVNDGIFTPFGKNKILWIWRDAIG